jgi:hypothetical protein
MVSSKFFFFSKYGDFGLLFFKYIHIYFPQFSAPKKVLVGKCRKFAREKKNPWLGKFLYRGWKVILLRERRVWKVYPNYLETTNYVPFASELNKPN